MGKQVIVQSDFSGGEVSPRLYGRIDADQYSKSVKTATNCLIYPQGPLRRRNGSIYISSTKLGYGSPCRLIEYQLSSTSTFIIEVGASYMRFYTNGAPIYSSGTTPYEITSPYTDPTLIQYTMINSTMYIVHPSFPIYTLTRVSNTNWSLSVLQLAPAPTKELGYAPNDNITLAATSGHAETCTAAAGGSAFLQGDVGRTLANTAGLGMGSIVGYSSVSVVTVNIFQTFASTALTAGTWILQGSPQAFLSFTYGDGSINSYCTLTAYTDSTKGTTQATFRSTDLGNYIRLNLGLFYITQVFSSSVINGVMLQATVDSSDQQIWSLEQTIWNSTNGYPSAIGQFQQRLWVGNTAAYPQDLWGSASGNYNVFAGGALDSNSINVTLVSDELNKIQWILGAKDLLVGTAGAEFALHSAEGSGLPITPTSITSMAGTAFGSADGQSAIKVGNQTLFIQKSNTKILGYQYQYFVDNYKAPDVTFWAEHMAAEGIVRVVQAQIPDSLIIAILESGDIMVGTYMPDLTAPVLGWCRWTTDGSYLDARVISSGSNDEIWLLVERTVGGVSSVYVEQLLTTSGSGLTDSFSDCSTSYYEPETVGTDNYTISAMTFASPGSFTTSTPNDYTLGQLVQPNVKVSHGISTFYPFPTVVPITPVDTTHFTAGSSLVSIVASSVNPPSQTTFGLTGYSASGSNPVVFEYFGTGSLPSFSVGDSVNLVFNVSNGHATVPFYKGDYIIASFSSSTDYYQFTLLGLNSTGTLESYYAAGYSGTAGSSVTKNVAPITVTNISSASPAVITSSRAHGLLSSHGYPMVVQLSMNGLAYYFLNGTYTVTVLSTTTFSITGIAGSPVFNSGTALYSYPIPGTGASSISGLSYLEGKTIEAKLDGAAHPPLVVTGGIAQFEYPGSEIVLGLPFQSEINTLPQKPQSPVGPLFYEQIRATNTSLQLYNSVIPTVNGNMRPARTMDTTDMDTPVPLFSGRVSYGPSSSGFDLKASADIIIDGPFPFELQNVITSIDGGVTN